MQSRRKKMGLCFDLTYIMQVSPVIIFLNAFASATVKSRRKLFSAVHIYLFIYFKQNVIWPNLCFICINDRHVELLILSNIYH